MPTLAASRTAFDGPRERADWVDDARFAGQKRTPCQNARMSASGQKRTTAAARGARVLTTAPGGVGAVADCDVAEQP